MSYIILRKLLTSHKSCLYYSYMFKLHEDNFKKAVSNKLLTITEFAGLTGYNNTLFCKLYNTNQARNSCTPAFMKTVMKVLTKKINKNEIPQEIKTEDIFVAQNKSRMNYNKKER